MCHGPEGQLQRLLSRLQPPEMRGGQSQQALSQRVLQVRGKPRVGESAKLRTPAAWQGWRLEGGGPWCKANGSRRARVSSSQACLSPGPRRSLALLLRLRA